MATVSLELPDAAEIQLPRKLGSVTLPIAKLPSAILARLVLHGARQKIADAYAGGKPTVATAQAVIEAWLRAEWSRRGDGDGNPEREAVIAAAKAFVRANPRPGTVAKDRIKAAVAAWFNPAHPRHAAVRQALGKTVEQLLSADKGSDDVI